MLRDKLDAAIATFSDQLGNIARKLDGPTHGLDVAAASRDAIRERDISLDRARRQEPLLIAEKTYNSARSDYDPAIVRNFPGRILNDDKASGNPIFHLIKGLASDDGISRAAWDSVLARASDEVGGAPHADLLMQRRTALDLYMKELSRRYQAHYVPGWVDVDNALLLYWLVRQLKPRTIVQCGVCNGLSSAFMVMALAKNGPEGRLHAIDLPPVFDADDPAWTIKGKVYGHVIPEGKTSGWLVPAPYRDRFDVRSGNAEILLPKLVDELDSIDLFYHDSDHSYAHMMFEFREARRKLAPGGLIVADDIAWNASLWDFADQQGVPAYNFNGSVGVAFF